MSGSTPPERQQPALQRRTQLDLATESRLEANRLPLATRGLPCEAGSDVAGSARGALLEFSRLLDEFRVSESKQPSSQGSLIISHLNRHHAQLLSFKSGERRELSELATRSPPLRL